MWEKLFAVLSWTLVVNGQYYDGLDSLGERISAQVAAQVAPLEGLGERITAQVNRGLIPMQVELDGLGDRITSNVHKELEPVRAIELNFKLMDGVGGTTIATHRPSGKQFIIKNYKFYTCSSQVNDNTGECSGSLTPFEITGRGPKSDWCYFKSYSLINNQICMSIGSVSITAFNDHISCRSEGNNPTILISLDEYKKLCSSVSEAAEYRYIPDVNDPRHVEIPNENKYVKCENKQRNLCIFNERNGLLDTYVSGGNGIFIGNLRSGGFTVTYS